jgi:hypothetical protein
MGKVYTALLLFGFSLTGCGGTSYHYTPEAGAIQPGPGLFSGDDGTFTVYQAEEKDSQAPEDYAPKTP